MSSNSFGQNKIGHKFCLPKTDPSNSRRITLLTNQPTLFKTCNLHSRHRKISIPASLVSNHVKPGFHVIVPQLYNIQIHKIVDCSEVMVVSTMTSQIHHSLHNMEMFRSKRIITKSSTMMSQDHEITKSIEIAQMSQNHEITKLHIFPCHSWNNYDTFQLQIQIVDGILTNNVNALNCTATYTVNVSRLQRYCQCTKTATSISQQIDKYHLAPYSHPLSR